MSKPTHEQIAIVLNIENKQVHQLANRGMPTQSIKAANKWFIANGFKKTASFKASSK